MANGRERGEVIPGAGGVIDGWLGINDGWPGLAPRYQHVAALQMLWENEHQPRDGAGLTAQLFDLVSKGWHRIMADSPRLPGKQNWRFEKRTSIDARHAGHEVTLERAIAKVTDSNWANQSPTMSGLLDAGGRLCNIDLIHRAGTAYTFVELKVADKTPLYAAMEMLQYGVTYLFSRVHAVQLGYDATHNEILRATEIHLRVLAPADYYDQGAIPWLCQLQNELSDGVELFVKSLKDVPVKMDFAFERFPDGFSWSPGHINQEDRQKDLLWALHRRQPLSTCPATTAVP